MPRAAAFEVATPGLLSTVQDAGRADHADIGVPPGGACDPWALAAANLLLGNPPGAAALEVTGVGPELRVLSTCVIGIAGADLGAGVVEEDRRLAPWSAHLLWPGSTIRFSGEPRGRAYLSLPGGIDVPPVLGSAATYLPARLGGIDGRAIGPGDRLAPLSGIDAGRAGLRWPRDVPHPPYSSSPTLRVIEGPHREHFAGRALDGLTAETWDVRRESDRMGVRLSGASVRGVRRESGELVSQGMVWGAVQVPASGEPIVLMADHQTVGGYPVIAVVISADRPMLGQLAPGDLVRFEEVGITEAQRARRQQRASIALAAHLLSGRDVWDALIDSAAG